MVELEDYGIGLSAVDAWVLREVIIDGTLIAQSIKSHVPPTMPIVLLLMGVIVFALIDGTATGTK